MGYIKNYNLICKSCLQPFMGKKGQKFCSRDCSWTYNHSRTRLNVISKTCPTCKKSFITSSKIRNKFCSANCRILDKRDYIIKIKECPICKKTFETTMLSRKYCSKSCRNKADSRRKYNRERTKIPCGFCGFSDLRAIHNHHINRIAGKGVISLCANHHYIFHNIIGWNKKSELLSKEEVLNILKNSDLSVLSIPDRI
jgi:endogenous inhibitor of DNA gyrase (YacG/DUF329 family)